MSGNGNQPAFPFAHQVEDEVGQALIVNPGLTKREFFAAVVMHAYVSNPRLTVQDSPSLAKQCFRAADAMIAEGAK